MSSQFNLKRIRGRLARALRDAEDASVRVREPMIPPRRLMFDGPRDPRVFRENGKAFLHIYVDLVGLEPDAHVLDVGSGMGRKTVALTRYLSPDGRYEGIEIVPAGVEWCTRQITSRYPNFEFTHLDIRSDSYNPDGTIAPTDVRFPFDDDSFDFVVLGSVFTHMLEAELDHYLTEIFRVLRPGAKALATYFLLNDDSRALIAEHKADFTFLHERGASHLEELTRPLAAVAYDQIFVTARYEAHGFEVLEPVYLGSWCGRLAPWSNEYGNYQDMIIATKPSPPATAELERDRLSVHRSDE